MRIAISGTHYSGKSTLIEELSQVLKKSYVTVDEPYYLLEEEGYTFSHPASLEDFEAMLTKSIELLRDPSPNILFDRCPLDFLAYAMANSDGGGFDPTDWREEIEPVINSLDLVVFIPIERVDCISVPRDQDFELRRLVDENLQDLLLNRSLGFDIEVLAVSGSLLKRRDQVLSWMSRNQN